MYLTDPVEGEKVFDTLYHPVVSGGWFYTAALDLHTEEILEPHTYQQSQAAKHDPMRLFSSDVMARVTAGSVEIFQARPIPASFTRTTDSALMAAAAVAYTPTPGAAQTKRHKGVETLTYPPVTVPPLHYNSRWWLSTQAALGSWDGTNLFIRYSYRHLTEIGTPAAARERGLEVRRPQKPYEPHVPGLLFDLHTPDGLRKRALLSDTGALILFPAPEVISRWRVQRVQREVAAAQKSKRRVRVARPSVQARAAPQASFFEVPT